MKILFLIILFILSHSPAFSDESIPKNPVSFSIEIVSDANSTYLALNYENYPKWHTYWKNPGDAGLPIKNSFTVNNKNYSLNELEWPAPSRFIEPGDMWAYGYEGAYTLFYKLTAKDLKSLENKTNFKSTWLVCKHICIPGQVELEFKIQNKKVITNSASIVASPSHEELLSRLAKLPQIQKTPEELNFKLSKGKNPNSLVLEYSYKTSVAKDTFSKRNLLYMFPLTPFDIKHEYIDQSTEVLKAQLEILWDGEYQTPPEPLSKNGKFKKPYTLKFIFIDPNNQKAVIINKTFTSFELTEAVINQVSSPPQTPNEESTTPKIVDATGGSKSLFYYLILAFVGGLILNIMPCVLPVISIKLFGLVKYRNESHAKVLKHNLFYTLGILVTFFILASLVLILKSIGSEVGWGFQLQSPNFIAIMIIGLFIFSLNLFGLFEFQTPGGSKLGNINTDESFFGDFLSGVLATVLSTPCSAPFLGTALTFAFTSSTLEIYLIFTMIGLGLAFPFIMTAVYPKLVAFIPKPGNWMNTVKKLLGIALLLTVVWLVDVFNALVDGQAHLIKLGTCLIFIFSGFVLHKKKEKWFSYGSFAFSVLLLSNIFTGQVSTTPMAESALIKDKLNSGLSWQAWSEEKMKEHQEKGDWVFIDFTAKWCFTCKVNERLVIETNGFKKMVTDKNLKLLIGDWTKRDEAIGSFLRKNGMVGVPAYFIQKPDGTLINLGETITLEKINSQIDPS